MKSDVLVSVLMTAYNREKYIGEAIECVLASSYNNFELIILDDCSIDHTVRIAQKFQDDTRVSIYINEKNLGQFANRNKIAQYARGEYLMIADSDDILLPNSICNCVEAMKMFPESSFGIYLPNSIAKPFLLDSNLAIHTHFFKSPFLVIGPGGTIIKRKYFFEIGMYPTNYGPAGDMYFNLNAACHSSIVLLPFEILNYRRHDEQEINNVDSYLINNYIYLKDALQKLPLALSSKELNWIKKKNKRRFIVNVCRDFFKNLKISKTLSVIKKTNFSILDFFQGVFH